MRLLVLVLLFLATHRASAQPSSAAAPAQTLMLLPVTENDAQLSRLRRVADAVGRELSQRGVTHLPYAESAALFQKRHSREPRTVSRENIEALVQESQRASRAAAARHANETKQVAAEAQARGADALESLNRDEAGARAYFGTCLALIRVLVANNERDAALKVARDCQAAVPDLAPNPHDHPPSVIQVFEEVERLAAAEGLGTLYVESEPTDCRVLLNGRLVGTTPYTRQAPAGHTYGVQVECGDPLPARVHEVTLKAAPTTVAVDVFLDRSVRTSRRALRLSYPRPDPGSARLHAAELARIVGADDVVLIASDDAQGLELHLLRRGTSARIGDDGEESLRRAVDALLSDPPPPPPEIAPAPVSRLAPVHTDAPPARRGTWLLPTGASLAGAGLVLGVVGALRYRAHVEDGENFHDEPKDRNYVPVGNRWRESRPMPYALVSAGSALAATGGIMLSAHLSPIQRRWLSPLFAAAGIGVLVAGVVDLRRGSSCPSNECTEKEHQLDRGALLMIASAPLLASSLAQLVWLRRGPFTVHATTRSVGATLRF
ncbi:MAG: PEGA domain-containing protein [Polyangiales bacterium]